MKTTGSLKSFFLKCLILNLLIIVFMSLSMFFSDQVYSIHSKWYAGSKEDFSTFLYTMVGVYKIIWIFFNVVPYLALRWLDKKKD